jgi:SAM-dependent methyltransferase
MNDRLGTDTHHPVRVTDERVLACLDGAAPDIGALWELCVYLEWDRAETLEGITAWLGPPEQLRVLDCACGSGFPAIDLARRGYDMTCSDGSPLMLDHFRRHARRAGVTLDAVLLRWDELSDHFGAVFDVVMCRGGGSLLYAGTWDDDRPLDRDALTDAVGQFVECLRPAGQLYVDTTRAENLARRDPHRIRHPQLAIGEHIVELEEVLTTDREHRVRIWRSRLRVDDATYDFERRSHYLPHDELVALLLRAGLTDVHEQQVRGESYTVFTGKRP